MTQADRSSSVGCTADALSRDEYLDGLPAAGFTDASVTFTTGIRSQAAAAAGTDAARAVIGRKAAATVQDLGQHHRVFEGRQAPWPRLGAMACAASPTSTAWPVT